MNGTFAERFAGESLDVLESILAHSRDCIKLLNKRGELEYLSASATDALGVADPSSLLGKVWRDLWPESERTKLDRAVAAAWTGTRERFDGITVSEDGGRRHWEVTISPVRGAQSMVTRLLVVSSEVTSRVELAEQSRERWERAENRANFAGVISHELRHRLKNQLAVVNAVAKLLARHANSASELARKLEEKLIAMGRAQDLLAVERAGPLTAAQAINEVLAASGAGERVVVTEIPPVALPEESVQQLSLVLGELQTNALKYGALRDVSGDVRLSGTVDNDILTLRWQEDCHREITAKGEGHGGFQLIRRLGSAGGKRPVIDWNPSGITVEIHIRVKE